MSAKQRFFIGGLGALMPVLVSLLAIDIGAMLDSGGNLTTGNIVGFVIRYLILFGIGGFVAYLHNDEQKPFKLFELGIAAPALLTSLITAQGLSTIQPAGEQHAWGISFMRSAHAGETIEQTTAPVMLASGFLDDVFKGASGSVYREIKAPAQETRQAEEPAPAQPAQGLDRGSSATPTPAPEHRAVQKQKSLGVKLSPMVAPEAGMVAAPRLSPVLPDQTASTTNPLESRVEKLRSRAKILKAKLRKTELELREAERALAQVQPAVQ